MTVVTPVELMRKTSQELRIPTKFPQDWGAELPDNCAPSWIWRLVERGFLRHSGRGCSPHAIHIKHPARTERLDGDRIASMIHLRMSAIRKLIKKARDNAPSNAAQIARSLSCITCPSRGGVIDAPTRWV